MHLEVTANDHKKLLLKLWVQETVGSSPATRTKKGADIVDSFFFSKYEIQTTVRDIDE